MSRGLFAWGVWALVFAGCSDATTLPCEDVLDSDLPRVSIDIGEQQLSAEVAATEEARSAAWAGRLCDLDALLWVPDQIEAPAVSLCGVELSIDLAFIRDQRIVAVELERPACTGPCDTCPIYGTTGPQADAVLWVPTGQAEFAVGTLVGGLDGVSLPTQ